MTKPWLSIRFLIKSGARVRLDVNTRSDGDYALALSFMKLLPDDLQVWLRDAELRDSVDMRAANYHFNVSKADTASFGANRFSLVFRQSKPQ